MIGANVFHAFFEPGNLKQLQVLVRVGTFKSIRGVALGDDFLERTEFSAGIVNPAIKPVRPFKTILNLSAPAWEFRLLRSLGLTIFTAPLTRLVYANFMIAFGASPSGR